MKLRCRIFGHDGCEDWVPISRMDVPFIAADGGIRRQQYRRVVIQNHVEALVSEDKTDAEAIVIHGLRAATKVAHEIEEFDKRIRGAE